jgi:hypothetical protein
VSELPVPPEPGQYLWGDDLNTYLLSLESRIVANEQRFAAYGPLITALEGRVDVLEDRVVALEARPDYIFGQAAYQFAVQMPPATSNQVRMNNANPQLATMLDFRRIDANGVDRTLAMDMVTPETLIRMTDADNGAVWYRFKATGPAVKVGLDNFNVPVEYHSSAGVLGAVEVNVGLLIVVPPQ